MCGLIKRSYYDSALCASKVLGWLIPIYVSVCFPACSIGGLRFIFSHISENYNNLGDDAKIKYLTGIQDDYCLYALILGFSLCVVQIVLLLFVRKRRREFEAEISSLNDQIKQLRGKLSDSQIENDNLVVQVKALRMLRQNIVTVLQNYLDSIAGSLKVTVKERITLYVIDSENKSFNIVRRYAEDHKLRAWTEISCPVDFGVRGIAWNKGVHYVKGLPDYNTDAEKYRKRSMQFGYTAKQVDSFKMKARTYFAYRYDSRNKQHHQAVLVIESMKPKYKSKAILRKEVERCANLIYHLIKDFYEYIPRSPIAAKEGL